MVTDPHPLLAAACQRHAIPSDGLRGLTVSVDHHDLTVLDAAGRSIETLDQLRRHANLPRRWLPLVVASAPTTERAQMVDELVRRGYSTPAIAAELGISPRTVTSERARLRTRAGLPGNTEDALVCVVGPPSLLRELIHDCLVDAEVGVARTPGYRPAASLVVAVRPSAREFDVRRGARIVTCGNPPNSVTLIGAIRRGLVGVVPPVPTPDQIVSVVLATLAGRIVFPDDSISQLVDELYSQRADSIELSRRDHDMLTAIRSGESMKQTARRLGISQKTVENLRRQLYQKLGARSAAEAVALAERAGAGG